MQRVQVPRPEAEIGCSGTSMRDMSQRMKGRHVDVERISYAARRIDRIIQRGHLRQLRQSSIVERTGDGDVGAAVIDPVIGRSARMGQRRVARRVLVVVNATTGSFLVNGLRVGDGVVIAFRRLDAGPEGARARPLLQRRDVDTASSH